MKGNEMLKLTLSLSTKSFCYAFIPLCCAAWSDTAAARRPEGPTQHCTISSDASFSQVSVRVADSTGATLERAEVEASCGSTVITGITGPDGIAVLNLRAGSYTVVSHAPGFAEKTLSIEAPAKAVFSIPME